MKINPIIPKQFKPLFDPSVRRIIEDSGRSAGKSTTNETAMVLAALDSGNHNSLYCRAEKNDLRDIFNSTVATISSMNLNEFFRLSLSPFEITCRTGAKIYFRGINGKTVDDLNTTKGFVPQNRSLKYFVVDEANETKCYNHVVAAESTANKFLLPEGKIIYAYNPPPSRKHWANIEFPKLVNQGATRIHTSWEDVVRFLKPATIEQILEMRQNDPLHYKYWYGGEIVNLEGAVIWSFDRKKHLMPLFELQRKRNKDIYYLPVHMFYGVDSGIKNDATVVSAWAIYPDGKLIKLGTMYYDIALERRKTGLKGVSHTDQVVVMLEWYRNFRKRMNDWGIILPDPSHERWCFDGAALTQDLMLEWEKTTRFDSVAVTNKDIERDNARLVNSFRSGKLFFLETEENMKSVDEYESFCYGVDNTIPEGQADHSIDADKYATYDYYYNYL